MNASAVLMIASSFLFSLMGVCVRLASETVAVSEVIFARSIIGLILIIPLILSQKASFKGRRTGTLMIRGVSGFLALSFYFWSISKIPLAMAVMLNYTSPIFVAFLAPLFLKEKFNKNVFFLILMGLIGVILIVKPSPETDLAGTLIGLISGIFASFAYLSIGALREDHSSLTIVFYFFWVSTLLSLPLVWFHFKMPTLPETAYLLGTGLFATAAQILMTRAYRLGSTAATSAYSSTIMLFSLIWGMVFWKEIPTFWSVFGGVLVVISIILISQKEKIDATPADAE